MGAVVIRTRYDEVTESAEVATSDVTGWAALLEWTLESWTLYIIYLIFVKQK